MDNDLQRAYEGSLVAATNDEGLDIPEYISVKEACSILGIKKQRIHQINKNKLSHYRIESRIFVSLDDVIQREKNCTEPKIMVKYKTLLE